MNLLLSRLLDKIFGPEVIPPPPPHKIQIIQRDICRLSLEEWCSSPELTSQARRCLSDAAFRAMLDVLDRSHPVHIVLNGPASLESRAVLQARCEGYTMCIADLEKMAVYTKPKEELEATFDPPETEE